MPRWNAETGELSCLGNIRRYGKNATNVFPVLEVFQSLGWPRRIASPFADDKLKHTNSITALNRGQNFLRFFSPGDGRSIAWQMELNDEVNELNGEVR